MRATRAYLAGLGTTGLLLAAAVALLTLVSALVGFDAWPGGKRAERVERIMVGAVEAPLRLATVDDDAVTVEGGPAAEGADAAGGVPATEVTGLGELDSQGRRRAPGGPVRGGGGSGQGAPLVPPSADDLVDALDPENPRGLRAALADGTERAVGGIATVAAGVSPAAGATIGGIGSAVADGVRAAPVPSAQAAG